MLILIEDHEVKEHIKKRYGEIAQQAESCCSSCEPSCCGSSTEDAALRIGYSEAEIGSIPKESNMGLGCGNPVALAGLKQGETVLDLGSGGGIDVFLAARKVGVKGKVIGVDMTEEMLRKAEASASEYGYGNVEFRQGEIENLPVEDGSVDVVISNCVINLSPDKESVFREAYRVLRPDGRIVVSDIVTEGELPEAVRRSLDAWTKCVAGALEKSEYLDTIRRAGFEDVKIVSESHSNICLCDEPSVRISSIQVEAHKGTTRTT